MAEETPLTLTQGQVALYVIWLLITLPAVGAAGYGIAVLKRRTPSMVLLLCATCMLLGSYVIDLTLTAASLSQVNVTATTLVGLECSSILFFHLFNILLFCFLTSVLWDASTPMIIQKRGAYRTKRFIESVAVGVWCGLVGAKVVIYGVALTGILENSAPDLTTLGIVYNRISWLILAVAFIAAFDITATSIGVYRYVLSTSAGLALKLARGMCFVVAPALLARSAAHILVNAIPTGEDPLSKDAFRESLAMTFISGLTAALALWTMIYFVLHADFGQDGEWQELTRLESKNPHGGKQGSANSERV